MPSVTQLARLFKLLSSRRVDAAMALGHEIANQEEHRGHRLAAETLRGALNPNGHAASGQPAAAEMPQPVGLLIEEPKGPPLSMVELRRAARQLLEDVEAEWTAREKLTANGIRRRTKLLFWGPPGCGKTLAARSLGHELGMPVMTARLSSVVGAYLGQTGANLRQLFAYAHTHRCVLLLDEFDAVGRTRGRSEDVGELDRIVISMLQELDHSTPAGLIIAATNLQGALDPALWRRFDEGVEFPSPNKKELAKFVTRRCRETSVGRSTTLRSELEKSSSYADVDRRIEKWRRDRILRGREVS